MYGHVKGTKPGNGSYTELLKEPRAHFYIHFKNKNLLTIVFVRIKIVRRSGTDDDEVITD